MSKYSFPVPFNGQRRVRTEDDGPESGPDENPPSLVDCSARRSDAVPPEIRRVAAGEYNPGGPGCRLPDDVGGLEGPRLRKEPQRIQGDFLQVPGTGIHGAIPPKRFQVVGGVSLFERRRPGRFPGKIESTTLNLSVKDMDIKELLELIGGDSNYFTQRYGAVFSQSRK